MQKKCLFIDLFIAIKLYSSLLLTCVCVGALPQRSSATRPLFFLQASENCSYSLARVTNSVHRFFTHTYTHRCRREYRNKFDLMSQMSFSHNSQCFILTFGLTQTQIHSVRPIFSNFWVLILPGKAMFAVFKSHLYCAVLDWRMK